MEITVKRIGYNVGTTGFLAAGLASGDITIVEGTLKSNNHHGLWAKCKSEPGCNTFLAGYDEYDIADREPGFAHYAVSEGGPYGERNGIWTEAAWSALTAIAQQWCDQCNRERSEDTGNDTYQIKRIAIGSDRQAAS